MVSCKKRNMLKETVWAVLTHSLSISHRKTEGEKSKMPQSGYRVSRPCVKPEIFHTHNSCTEFRDNTLKQALSVSSYIPHD